MFPSIVAIFPSMAPALDRSMMSVPGPELLFLMLTYVHCNHAISNS